MREQESYNKRLHEEARQLAEPAGRDVRDIPPPADGLENNNENREQEERHQHQEGEHRQRVTSSPPAAGPTRGGASSAHRAAVHLLSPEKTILLNLEEKIKEVSGAVDTLRAEVAQSFRHLNDAGSKTTRSTKVKTILFSSFPHLSLCPPVSQSGFIPCFGSIYSLLFISSDVVVHVFI